MWAYSLCALAIALYILYYRWLHPLGGIPGPFLASVTRLWLVHKTRQWKRHSLEIELHRKYGPVVRISPNEVLFSDPAYFKHVYGAGTNFKKGAWYRTTADPDAGNGPEVLNMLPEMNLDKLRVQKRLVGPIYSIQNVKRHESRVDAVIEKFITRMSGMREKPLDMYTWLELLCIGRTPVALSAHGKSTKEILT